jgi:hypothetical protein
MKCVRLFTLIVAGALLASAMAGCERDDVASLPNPQVDGVYPHQSTGPDMSIMEDQKALHDRMMESAGTAAKSAGTTASAPAATMPATEPADNSASPVTPP